MSVSHKYHQLRESVSQRVIELFIAEYPQLDGELRLTDIDDVALQFLNHEWVQNPDPLRTVGTADDWLETVRAYRTSYSSRIELAIWYGETLCAVVLGKPSRSKMILKINYLEGNFNANELKGLRLRIAILYAEVFAAALDIEWVGIQSPYEGAIPLYEEEGYTEGDPYDHNNNAICKRLEL